MRAGSTPRGREDVNNWWLVGDFPPLPMRPVNIGFKPVFHSCDGVMVPIARDNTK